MKVKVVGTAMIVTSTLTAAQMEAAKHFCPNATTVVDDEGNDVYRLDTAESASVGKYGTNFNGKDADGNLTATVIIPDAEDKKAYVTENFGIALAALAEAETLVAEAIEAKMAVVNGAVADMEIE